MSKYVELQMEAKASEQLRKEIEEELRSTDETRSTAAETEEIIRRNTRVNNGDSS